MGWVEDVEDVLLFLEQWSIVQDVHLWMLLTIEELKSNTMFNKPTLLISPEIGATDTIPN